MNIRQRGYSHCVDMDEGGKEGGKGRGEGGDRLKVCKREIGVLTLLWEELQKKKKNRWDREREWIGENDEEATQKCGMKEKESAQDKFLEGEQR